MEQAKVQDKAEREEPDFIRYDRSAKQLGDFGEQLVMFLIGRLYKNEVAYVDHVGADLIAQAPGEEKGHAISVKSRVFTTDGPQQPFDASQQEKLEYFAKTFNLTPMVAFVCIDKIDRGQDINIDVYMIDLEDFRKLAKDKDAKGITATGTNGEILHFSNAPANQQYLQHNELINFHRLTLHGMEK